jgi:hypothetical protein
MKRGGCTLEKIGTVTIEVYKDSSNQYSFTFDEDNEDLSCVVNVLEDTLKYY